MEVKYIQTISIVMILSLFVTGNVWAGQAGVPIYLNMSVNKESSSVVRLTIYMTAQGLMEKGELVINAPDGAMLYEGQTRWAGSMRAGDTVKLVSWYDISDVTSKTAPTWKALARGLVAGMDIAKTERAAIGQPALGANSENGRILSKLATDSAGFSNL
jgi:hypothetical protein